jgi:Hypothetical glycosyl hydrolase 6/Beta-galactosidase trimerisation domain
MTPLIIEPDVDHQWLKTSLVMIMTMRADDAPKWDAPSLVALAQSFSLGALGFSVGGVTAFYPTKVAGHPVSPSLGERDLVDETVAALHGAGIRAIGRIDPSAGSSDELRLHPGRFARTEDGKPIRLHDFYLTCPNGDHYGQFMLEVVREILERYQLDGLWANAAQFSPWGAGRCFCDNCKRLFRELTDSDFPQEDWQDPIWKRYNEWRYERIADWNRRVKAIIDEVRPSCAWLPLSQVIESWDHTRKGGWDVDLTSVHSDGIVLEAQRRYCNLWWPGMEARYAHAMNPEAGAGITVSYFYPWWRFTHAPVPENRVWVAQMIANGARPWLHLTGYFSDHFDRRGITPMQELFKFIHAHGDVYGPRHSAAEVALVYSRTTLDYAGAANPDLNYLDGFRGAYNALMDARLPFDLISDKRINASSMARYKAVLIPNLVCMSDSAAAELEAYMQQGGHVVATYRTGFCDVWGNDRPEPLIAAWLGARYTGETLRDLKAAYAAIDSAGHPVVVGAGDTDLLPLAGSVCRFHPGEASDAEVLRLIPPVEAWEGSGMSVPEFNSAGRGEHVPLLLTRKIGMGGLIYFPWEPDRIGFHFGLRDPMRLISSALKAAKPTLDLVRIEGAGLIDVSVMDTSTSRVLHLVNFNSAGGIRSGHRRAVEDVIPLHGLIVDLQIPREKKCCQVKLTVAAIRVPYVEASGRIRFTIPVLREFESVLVDLA